MKTNQYVYMSFQPNNYVGQGPDQDDRSLCFCGEFLPDGIP